ncbi:hypothetical protein G9O61_00g019450, partial [Vairimorpha ceranae]
MWTVSSIFRRNTNTFFEIVDSRQICTLVELISRKVAPELVIITNCLRGYPAIPNICVGLGFTHETVNHSVNFVDNVS